jgi:hypothetical protein
MVISDKNQFFALFIIFFKKVFLCIYVFIKKVFIFVSIGVELLIGLPQALSLWQFCFRAMYQKIER